jgi:hypothetical protein
VSARTCQQWQVPLVDGRRAIYGLHGVAANGLTISVCCTCMLCQIVAELWVEVGQNKNNFALSIYSFIG